MSGPGHFPTGKAAEATVAGSSDPIAPAAEQPPHPRRQRHMRIKKLRDQAAARNQVNTDDSYPVGSTATASTSTLTSAPVIPTGKAPLPEASSSENKAEVHFVAEA